MRLPVPEQRMFVEALLRLASLRLILAILGRRRQIGLYGRGAAASVGEAVAAGLTLADDQRRTAAAVAAAIRRAESALPFEVNCLPQALVGRQMLRKRGIASVMFFGVELGAAMNDADTHAWLAAADVPVTGYPVEGRYLAFASFPPVDAMPGP